MPDGWVVKQSLHRMTHWPIEQLQVLWGGHMLVMVVFGERPSKMAAARTSVHAYMGN